jgi:hypothetical protein
MNRDEKIKFLQSFHEAELTQKILIPLFEDVELLMSLIGVGYFTALLYLYEVGDIKRFPSASKLASWIGLVPRVHQSGDACYYGKITKKGSPLLRWALIQAAQSAVRSLLESKISLAVTMYHILTRREPYWFGRETTYNEKLKKAQSLSEKSPNQPRRSTCLAFLLIYY